MKRVRILHIGDLQNGFTRKDGNLYVQGSQEILTRVSNFLSRIREKNSDLIDYTFIILDTHFAEEYLLSDEGKLFPIHCEYGTEDWKLSIDTSGLPNMLYLMKNQFNMWGRHDKTDIRITDPIQRTAHDKLFRFTDDLTGPAESIDRDEFIAAICHNHIIEVGIIGVASDFCIRYAMEGWLEKGARVTIIRDLTKGIEKETSQVLEELKYQQYIPGRLRMITSTEYLNELMHQVTIKPLSERKSRISGR